MSLTVTDSGAGDYAIPPEGPHAAYCSHLIDLGTQTVNYEGKTSQQRKVLLGWTLPDAAEDGDATPPVVWRRLTASLSEAATLRKLLVQWRGRQFTGEELAAFDLRKVAGAPCFLSVVHNTKGERTYANVGSLMPLPKGMPAPAQPVLPVVFDLAAPDWDLFAEFSERLQATIAAAPEYQAAMGQTAAPAAPPANAPAQTQTSTPHATSAPPAASQTPPAGHPMAPPSAPAVGDLDDPNDPIPF